MKKLAVALFLVLACAPAMFAVGSVTCTVAPIGNTNIYALTWAWTADASAATVPADTCAALNANSGLLSYHILSFTFVPGSPAPTNLYSATIKDGNGVDQLGAQGAAALLTATPQSFGVTAGANAPLNGTLTLAVTGNAVNSAKGTVIVYVGPQTVVASKVTSGGGGAPTGAAGGDLAGTYPNPTLGANFKKRSIGAGFDGAGSALTTSTVAYVTVPFACTVSAWNIVVDTGTATVDVWKIATGTAKPTVSNTITASALPAISTGTAVHSTTLTAWTTGVTANDIFGFNINAVSSATKCNITLECDQ